MSESFLTVGLSHFLVLGTLLFSLGLITVLTKKNLLGLLMGIELILNGANVNLVAVNHYIDGALSGGIFTLFVIVVAAAEAAVAFAIAVSYRHEIGSTNVTDAKELRL